MTRTRSPSGHLRVAGIKWSPEDQGEQTHHIHDDPQRLLISFCNLWIAVTVLCLVVTLSRLRINKSALSLIEYMIEDVKLRQISVLADQLEAKVGIWSILSRSDALAISTPSTRRGSRTFLERKREVLFT